MNYILFLTASKILFYFDRNRILKHWNWITGPLSGEWILFGPAVEWDAVCKKGC